MTFRVGNDSEGDSLEGTHFLGVIPHSLLRTSPASDVHPGFTNPIFQHGEGFSGFSGGVSFVEGIKWCISLGSTLPALD